MQIFVMLAWIAGIQIRRMRPEASMSAWIPAFHAGMTQSEEYSNQLTVSTSRIFEGGHEKYLSFHRKCSS
jgi:hypothetical protein